jgi:large subunit ribosomal protein L6
MSRIGRRPVAIPEKVSVESARGEVRVKGPKGELVARVPASVRVEVDGGTVRVARENEKRQTRALHGLMRASLANMVRGVTQGFRRDLEIEGVGYRAEANKQRLVLVVGLSHPVELEIPDGVSVQVEGNTKIRVEGTNREQVGQFAANIRAVRPPEPYKGKGIRYAGERVRRKVGKAGTA